MPGLLHLWYSDHAVVTLPANHRFPRNKHRAIRELLQQEAQTSDKVAFFPSPPACPEDLLRVHPKEYIDSFTGGKISHSDMRRVGFPWHESVVKRQYASVGGTMAAAKAVLQHPELKITGHLAGLASFLCHNVHRLRMRGPGHVPGTLGMCQVPWAGRRCWRLHMHSAFERVQRSVQCRRNASCIRMPR
jgi:acetoin utilization deacetylase AcuC-like enzyme